MTGRSFLNLCIATQCLTMIGVGLYFWQHGDKRLGLAEFCYLVATIFIFGGK